MKPSTDLSEDINSPVRCRRCDCCSCKTLEPTARNGKQGDAVMELGKNFQTQARSLLPPPSNIVRNKVALTPGHSLMDWIRLGKSGKDLTGVGGQKLTVTEEELAKHNTLEDCWMAIGGRVYNITPYMDFHPGGVPELMRAAGKDGTKLFDEVHKWVNAESMLKKCIVGDMQVKKKVHGSLGSVNSGGSSPLSLDVNGVSKASLPGVSKPHEKTTSLKQVPRYSWFQNTETLTISVYTQWDDMQQENVIIDRTSSDFKATLMIKDHTFVVHLELEAGVSNDYDVVVRRPSGSVDIMLHKLDMTKNWTYVGKSLVDDKTFVKNSQTEVHYRSCEVINIDSVSHDTYLYCIKLPDGCRMCVPLGYHVYIRANISDMEVAKAYTVVPPSVLKEKQDVRVSKGKVFYLMVKIYPDGVLTPFIGKLKIGNFLDISNPAGNFAKGQLDRCSHLVMYAAGTGFTPMAGLILQAAQLNLNPDRPFRHMKLCCCPIMNSREILMMFFNKETKDIYWQTELDEVARTNSRFHVKYVLSRPQPEWTGLRGRVCLDLVKGFVPPVAKNSNILFCVCGPAQFTEATIQLVKDLGYSEGMIHAFTG
ncbi:Cytochrome b5 reductase 4 [Lamellibrachia satsuma]|nr:Cytochrome b5 reductase 4 [Lamellibrachia satsuma]